MRSPLFYAVGGFVAVIACVVVIGLAAGGLFIGGLFGVAVKAVANACSQTNSSSSVFSVDPVNFSGNSTGFTPEQVTVMNTAVGVVYAHNELTPVQQLQLARIVLSIGLVESGARNLRYGDASSLGWIQQQAWWGTVEQRTNVAISTELLISGGAILPQAFNGRADGSEPGILDFKGWDTTPAGEVAWRIQQPRIDLRYKYAAQLPVADRFLAGKLPSSPVILRDGIGNIATGTSNWTGDCTGIDPGGLGTKDGFTFPLMTTKAVIEKGVEYNGSTWTWCYTSLTNCHHDYNAADIHAPPGTTVVAAMAGVVVKVVNLATCSGPGDLDVPRITIRDTKTNLDYYYTHLLPGSLPLKAGDNIAAGQPIGKVGPGECAEGTGPHLHFNVIRGGMGNTSDPTVRARMVDMQPLLVGAFNQIGISGSPASGTWVLPIDAVITSCFGLRSDPLLGTLRLHDGTDFAGPYGAPVVSAGDGVIEAMTFNSTLGYYVTVRHSATIRTRSQHLSKFEPGLKVGDPVKAGQVIGYVGSTGRSTGPHDHFSLLTGVDGSIHSNPEAFLVSKGVKLPNKTGSNC